MLRNRTDASYNVADCTYPLGCYYQVPTSWFMVNESNKFIRPDLDEFTLASRNSQAADIIANLASLTAGNGSSMAKTELGAHALKDSTWCLDGIARDLIGTDYLLSATSDGQATVAEAGNVIICVKEANTALVEKLETEGWTLLADKCRTALGVMATGSNDLLYTTSYYYKNCEVGEVITTSGQYSLVFGKASDSTPEAAYKTTPAYISFDAVNEAFYKEEENINNCCPSLAVTNNGRLYACYMTGDEIDSRMENCGVVKYSDDDGKTWTPLFVLDTWENQVIGSTKQTVCFDIELKTDPETNVVYATYALRQNIDGSQTLDTQTWMFTISNPDSDTMTKDGLGISEQWNTGYGFSRNAFTILSDGTFMIIPNGTEHSEINHVYVSKDKGQTWNIFGDMYLPQAINSDEPVIVEKTDGSLWCLARTELGYLCQSFSYDDGKTWTVGRQTDIQNPSSRFFITRLASGKLMMVHNDNTLEKIGMVVAISEDDGETWENKLNLHDGYASYPVVVLDNSTGKEQIHIIFDDGRDPDNQWRTGEEDGTKYKYFGYIYHTILTEEEIMAGGDPNEDETEILMVGDSYTESPYWWKGFESSFGTYGGESIGVGGTRVDYWNNTQKLAEIAAKNPKNLFVNIGINDIGWGTAGETVGNDVVAFLTALKNKLPNTQIYYNMIVYPANSSYSYNDIDASNKIVEAYIDGDTEDNVHKIDIRKKMLLHGEADEKKFIDRLHMTPEGYAILSEAIQDATGIGRKTEVLNEVSRLSKKVYNWTVWEECEVQSDATTRYNARGYATDEGLYINAVQYVDNIVKTGDTWTEQTHLEAMIWQHNIGYGMDGTYCWFGLDNTCWFNDYRNIKNIEYEATVTDRGANCPEEYRYKIFYEIFIEFDNNLNGVDGPYAYVQLKHHMPGETEKGFENSYKEHRDGDRYLWQDNCEAYEFRESGIVGKDPYSVVTDAPTRYNVHGRAVNNGLRINAEQYVDNVVSTGDGFTEQTHLEAQIWHHNIGAGVNYGFDQYTYFAFWQDGTYYVNNNQNIKNITNNVTVQDRGTGYADGYRYKITYDIFIEFDNNLENPADGPYAYVQLKYHMPGETEEGFENARKEHRDDNRYLWQDQCDSYEFRSSGIAQKVMGITKYKAQVEDRKLQWLEKGNDGRTTLFIGDSFFDTVFWSNFYTDYYAGKDALTLGICSTTTYDWETWSSEWLADIEPKNIVMHIGTNNIYDDGDDVNATVSALKDMFTVMHKNLPDTSIYWFGISYRSYDEEKIAKSAEINTQMKEWCAKQDYMTYIDTPSKLTNDMLLDNIHPKPECYNVFTEALAETDIVIEDSLLSVETDASTRYQVRGYAADEGLRVNAVQYVDNVVSTGDKWTEQTHLEAQIWQHNIGMGVENGFSVDTYFAFFQDGTYYVNNNQNIKNITCDVTVHDRGADYTDGYRYAVFYEIFIEFENNLANPADGPYAFVQFKHHMPGETEAGFENSNKEHRDSNRYLYQDNCTSYEFRKTGIVGKPNS